MLSRVSLAIFCHSVCAGAVSDPRGKYRETRSPTIAAATSPIALFLAPLLLQAAARGARARATVCLRSMRLQYSHLVPAAQKSYCLQAQRNRAYLPQFFAVPRISNTRRAARLPKCCGDRVPGAMPPVSRSLHAETASDLDHAMSVFHRLHRAGQERDRQSPRRVLPRDITIGWTWRRRSESLPTVFLLAPAAPQIQIPLGRGKEPRSRDVCAAYAGRCCYRPRRSSLGRPAC